MVGVLSNKISREELKPGDHIYTWKHSYLYSHHGIYVGDGKYGVSPSLFLLKVRGGTCTLATSDPPKDVLHRAEFLLQNGFGVYDIFKNNCEDFAIYCKTSLLIFTSLSVGRSGQAASILAAASAIVSSPLRFLTTSFTGLAVVSCGIYCISRFVSDIGVRRDVIKVPVERLVTQSGLDDSEVTTEASTERLVAQSGLDDSEVTTEASTERLVAQSGLDDSEVTTEASTERLVAQSGLDDSEVTTEAAMETVKEDKICSVDQNHVD
ncbi:hypothetical protein F0562_006741 [Nyssa sinensis]|uniref:LRAT domain-containing protein n=1 Tax=Nyssa sinensis TaxID=561372 RepID=A0A5J5ARW6_9ASTE|nr:hypothetical protein F0562_006741 [Nyssa sinensis]